MGDLLDWPLSCDELVNVGLVSTDVFCCNSCHDDEDEGYAGLLEHYVPDSVDCGDILAVWARTCCAVGEALKAVLEVE